MGMYADIFKNQLRILFSPSLVLFLVVCFHYVKYCRVDWIVGCAFDPIYLCPPCIRQDCIPTL